MGFLDHLFKSKSESNAEKPAENRNGRDKGAEGAAPPASPDPSAFLHPKAFTPDLAPLPLARQANARHPVQKPPGSTITLALGDVIARIPTQLLRAGIHDERRELRFEVSDLSSDIARGRAAVPLSKIAAICPDIFRTAIGPTNEMEIRLPLQKLVDQIGLLRPTETRIIPEPDIPSDTADLPATPDIGSDVESPASEPSIITEILGVTSENPSSVHTDSSLSESPISESQNITPPSPASLILTPSEDTTASPVVSPEQHEEVRPSVARTAPLLREEKEQVAAEAERPAVSTPPFPLRTPIIQHRPLFVPSLKPPIIVADGSASLTSPTPILQGTAPTAPPAETESPMATVHPLIARPTAVTPPVFAAAGDEIQPAAPTAPRAESDALEASGTTRPKSSDLEKDASPQPLVPSAALQELLMTDEVLDLSAVAGRAAALPGIEACVIFKNGSATSSGKVPLDVNSDALAAAALQIATAMSPTLGKLQNLTLDGANSSITFFPRIRLCLCAMHQARFRPGVREKLAAIADELANGEGA